MTVVASSAYASSDNPRINSIISDLDLEITEEGKGLLSSEVSLLLQSGFTDDDIKKLNYDIRQVANLIRTNKMSTEEIANLKNGFLNSRPEDPKLKDKNQVGKSLEEVGMPNTLRYKNKTENEILATDTGAHLALFTQPSYKFYEYTGYVNLGSVHAHSSNTRPYVMFGGHGSSGSGVDAGLVYWKESNSWGVFANNGKWEDGVKKTKIAPSSRVYINFRAINQYAQVIVRDPNTWNILDEQSVYMGGDFTTNPSNLELVRENTLAQKTRNDDGSYLKNVTWSNVYLYSATQTTPAKMSFMKTSRNGFYVYSGRYLYGETVSAKNYISASNLNYDGETSSISY